MNNLKKIREKAHKTKKEIYENVLKVDKGTYDVYENTGKISSEFLIKLSDYYSEIFHYYVSIDYLLGRVQHPFQDTTLGTFADRTHLSEDAISNIIYEGSEKGDNRYIQILNYLLSDKEVFTSLMDYMCSLIKPNTWIIDLKNIPEPMLVKNNEDRLIQIPPEILKQMNNEMPDNVYQGMKHAIEDFLKRIPKQVILSKNRYHPTQII